MSLGDLLRGAPITQGLGWASPQCQPLSRAMWPPLLFHGGPSGQLSLRTRAPKGDYRAIYASTTLSDPINYGKIGSAEHGALYLLHPHTFPHGIDIRRGTREGPYEFVLASCRDLKISYAARFAFSKLVAMPKTLTFVPLWHHDAKALIMYGLDVLPWLHTAPDLDARWHQFMSKYAESGMSSVTYGEEVSYRLRAQQCNVNVAKRSMHRLDSERLSKEACARARAQLGLRRRGALLYEGHPRLPGFDALLRGHR